MPSEMQCLDARQPPTHRRRPSRSEKDRKIRTSASALLEHEGELLGRVEHRYVDQHVAGARRAEEDRAVVEQMFRLRMATFVPFGRPSASSALASLLARACEFRIARCFRSPQMIAVFCRKALVLIGAACRR